MAVKASVQKKTFIFSFSARTSRGPMKERHSWFIKLWEDTDPEVFGIGECGPLPGLSAELNAEFETTLSQCIGQINSASISIQQLSSAATSLASLNEWLSLLPLPVQLNDYPSVRFALETAFLDLYHGGKRMLFDNDFLKGEAIPINGLIWMGGMDFMLQQIEIKIRDGFRCIKLKVGGLDFEKECDVLQYIRRKYFRDDITIRLDANGAFKTDEALYKLKELAKFKVHSIEQPLKKGSEYLPQLCKESPIPIALDEELIGVTHRSDKEQLLERIQPQFIILKPSMHGGLWGSEEWIAVAEAKKIDWWITSALESNIGLNAIAQFTANYTINKHHGLGTGGIYENNVPSPLRIDKEHLLSGRGEWDLSEV